MLVLDQAAITLEHFHLFVLCSGRVSVLSEAEMKRNTEKNEVEAPHCPQVEALVALFATVMGKRPAFRAHGGSNAENLALQNIQVCLRGCKFHED